MGHRHTPHRLVSGSIPGGAHQSSLAEQRVPVIPHQKLDAFVWGSRRRSAPAGAPKSE